MKCEANGCTAALEPKSLPGSAMGGPSPWVVTDIPPGWCVRLVENVDIGSGRLVVLCPVHSAGIVPAPPAKPRPRYKVVADERTGVAHCPDLPSLGHFPGPIDEADGPWADPHLEAARLRAEQDTRTRITVLREVVEHLRNCGTPRDYGEYQVELEAEIGFYS